MLDSDSIVLEKCNFVHEKSLKRPWIPFLKKVWEPWNKNALYPNFNVGYLPVHSNPL